MKVSKWSLLLVLLGVNQMVRSPYSLWNWTAKMSLLATQYNAVTYESTSSHIEVLEKPYQQSLESIQTASAMNQRNGGVRGVESTAYSTSDVLVVLPDVRSSIGFWKPWLENIQFDGTIRYIEWYGKSSSEWKESTIVFSDLDSLLNIVLADVEGRITIVGQGLGSQLGIRYIQAHPDLSVDMIAIHSAGFSVPDVYPQTIDELQESVSADLQGQWLPKFIYRNWLTALNNPFLLAIEQETHLVPHLKLIDLPKVTWVGYAPEGIDPTTVLLPNCSREAQWTCLEDWQGVLDSIVTNREP